MAQLIESIDSANLDPLTRGTLGFELGVLTASFGVGELVALILSGKPSTRGRAMFVTLNLVFTFEEIHRLIIAVKAVVDEAATPELVDVAQFSLAEQRRRLIYGMAGLANFADSVRAGDLDAALVASSRIHGSFTGNEFLSAYMSRLLEYQQDIAFSTPLVRATRHSVRRWSLTICTMNRFWASTSETPFDCDPRSASFARPLTQLGRAALPPTSIRSGTV